MAGEYRPILTEQLKKDGLNELSELIANKNIMIAITNSIQGNVRTREDLKDVFIDTLERANQIHSYKYANGLREGTMIPIESISGQTSYNFAGKDYSPGELFFTT